MLRAGRWAPEGSGCPDEDDRSHPGHTHSGPDRAAHLPLLILPHPTPPPGPKLLLRRSSTLREKPSAEGGAPATQGGQGSASPQPTARGHTQSRAELAEGCREGLSAAYRAPTRAPLSPKCCHPSGCGGDSERDKGSQATAVLPPGRHHRPFTNKRPTNCQPLQRSPPVSRWRVTRHHGRWLRHLPDHTWRIVCGDSGDLDEVLQEAMAREEFPCESRSHLGQRKWHIPPGSQGLNEDHRGPSPAARIRASAPVLGIQGCRRPPGGV